MLTENEDYRQLTASVMAQGFLIEVLLVHYLKHAGKENAADLAATIQSRTMDGEAFTGVARDEADAEFLADVVVKMRDQSRGMIERALRGVVGG
jgi:hypothetical protein